MIIGSEERMKLGTVLNDIEGGNGKRLALEQPFGIVRETTKEDWLEQVRYAQTLSPFRSSGMVPRYFYVAMTD